MARSTGRALFQHTFVPALLLLWVLAWSGRAGGVQALKAAGVPLDFSTVVLLVTVVLLWAAEAAFPLEPRWHYALFAPGPRGWVAWGDLLRDLVYLLLVAQASAALITAAGTRIHPLLAWAHLALWPAHAPFLVRVALAFFCVELFSYWMHRAAHRVPVLWRFHSTHHVVSELTTLKALRTHPVDNLLFHVARSVPLLAVGVGAEELTAVVALGGTLSLLAHANVDVAHAGLGLVVNFPRYHALHHALDLSESQCNYGCHTVLWDRVFGTFREQAVLPQALGLSPPGRRTLWQELGWPFFRSPH